MQIDAHCLTGDWIQIHDLKILTRIGVYTWEQHIHQTLLVNIACLVDLSLPVAKLTESVDYAAISEAVTVFVSERSFELIETVAQQVADLVLEQFKVRQVRILVKKPHAIANASGVSVSLIRSKSA